MIVGIDEVGRGCWAGPLVAGAVVLGEPIPGLKDSKKLSKAQRERLTKEIRDKALAIGLGWVWPAEIDRIGLTAAVTKAMREALEQIQINYDDVIIDGHLNFLPDHPKTQAIIKADDTVPAVSAASIVAKVARDYYMAKASEKFPGYGFESHVGYGTAAHMTAIQKLGVCVQHRRSFKPIQKIVMAEG
jgi:ribonuclease HII